MTFLSAADLIKRSAKQILFLRQHPDKNVVTQRQLDGVEEQKFHVKSPFVEMRGMFNQGDITIFFSVDEAIPTSETVTFVEHKMAQGDSAQWFLDRAIEQTAAYHSLGSVVPVLETATFYHQMGHERMRIEMGGRNIRSKLRFGETWYDVCVTDPQRIRELMIAKARSTTNWTAAKLFGENIFHKEILKGVIYRRSK